MFFKNKSVHACQVLLCTLVILAIDSIQSEASYAVDWSKIPARDNQGTILIRTNWSNTDGPQGGTATGFVVSGNNHILTVAHQFPTGDFPVLSTGETEGWRSSYPRQNFPLKLVHINRSADFAIMVPTKPATILAVPTSWNWEPREGDEVYARGFRLGGPLEGMEGNIRRSGVTTEVPMSHLISGGFSGAPVYDSEGKVVCMVRGGTPVTDSKDPTLMGLGFCVPLSLLKDAIPASVVAASIDGSSSGNPKTGSPIRVSYPLNTTKETGFAGPLDLFQPATTKEYPVHLKAANGYRIIDYEYLEHSANQASKPELKISPDGSSLMGNYKLTSGPGYDRKRGWLAATIVTIQEPKEGQ